MSEPATLLAVAFVTLLAVVVGIRRRHLRGAPKLMAGGAAAAIASAALVAGTSPATAAGCDRTVLDVVAHADDSLLFLSPDLLHDIQSGACVTTIYLTAGDQGLDPSYWQARENGTNAAYAEMAGVPDNWTRSLTPAAGHQIATATLGGANVTQMFFRLPDGNTDGNGFAADHNESMLKLWRGGITVAHPVDGSPAFTAQDVRDSLTALMTSLQPSVIRAQDYTGFIGDNDHADHHVASWFTRAASNRYTTPHQLVGYLGYDTQYKPQNVFDPDLTARQNALYAYNDYDVICSPTCAPNTGYAQWLMRQYVVDSSSYPQPNHAPTANAGHDRTVFAGSSTTLVASGTDPDGDLLSYQWTQTAGPTVTLTDASTPQPTFQAPASSATLTFQVVASDGDLSSAPSSVNVNVSDSQISLIANASASSENSGATQTASKAIDGIIDGYPHDYTKEWATTSGGGAGAWLKLNWAHAESVTKVVLHDRPNDGDQVTGGTLDFGTGDTINVGALPNDGSGLTIDVPDVATRNLTFTVTSVSGSTSSPGLAEVEVFGSLATNVVNHAPVADAGPAQTVPGISVIHLDGSASSDPDGDPLTYRWSQVSGPDVTLSDPTSATPTFVSPAGADTMSFQLVVNDGMVDSAPSVVTITDSGARASSNVALAATATASSSDTGQTPDKAIDGVVDGYPRDFTKEWATHGGDVGSWLHLSWTGPQTITKVVLHDRPNSMDQLTSGTLRFGTGTTIPFGALPNDGTGLTVTVPDITVKNLTMTVNSMSDSTANVGLAEIEVYGAAATDVTDLPPTADAGPAQTVPGINLVQLDGTRSSDPDDDAITYHWTQTGGPAVELSDQTSATPTFMSPPAAGTLTFQLVVNDGDLDSAPSTVAIEDTGIVRNSIADQATATASSENVGTEQTADKAIDGVADGFPGDYTHEWATNGGRAGSWLTLTWPTAQRVDQVVLHDRPNDGDQITSATLNLGGTTISVGALPNDGSPLVVPVPSIVLTRLTLTVDSVSGSTGNVGLSEIEVWGDSAADGTNHPPTADAGPAQTVSSGSLVQLDGTNSADPDGDGLNYSWAQTGGPMVALSDPTDPTPTFTAPDTAATLTFQLVVNDGDLVSEPSTVEIVDIGPDLARAASVTASSENPATGQTADKAVDGVNDGYPGDYSHEWATNGGGPGSWYSLMWTDPQTIDRIVLHDRPNGNDQVTSATLTFDDGTSIDVAALPNDGSGLSVAVPNIATRMVTLTINTVSGTTQNVGLAEFEAYGTSS